jgi:glycosyltransferase involved in cell wall biosynthesis
VAQLEDVELTLVGDGSLHGALRALAERRGLNERIKFIPALSNADLCVRLADYDIFALHSDYREISKAVLEALLTGLPVVINRRASAPVPELTPDICVLVENTAAGYRDALQRLIADHRLREELGRTAGRIARAQWHPAITESRYVDIYRNLLSRPS